MIVAVLSGIRTLQLSHIQIYTFFPRHIKRDLYIKDQHLARHFKNNGEGLLSLYMQSNNYPFLSFNALRQ